MVALAAMTRERSAGGSAAVRWHPKQITSWKATSGGGGGRVRSAPPAVGDALSGALKTAECQDRGAGDGNDFLAGALSKARPGC